MLPTVLCTALSALLVAFEAPEPPNWDALVRDPAAQTHWADDDTLWLIPSGSSEPGTAVDARTGARSPVVADDVARLTTRGLERRGGRSRSSAVQTRVTFRNESGQPVELLWVDPQGLEHSYGTLAPGASRSQHTYQTHVWKVQAADGTLLGFARGRGAPSTVVIGSRPAAQDESQRDADDDRPRLRAPPPGGGTIPLPPDPAPALPEAARALSGPEVWSPDGSHVVVFEHVPEQEHLVHIVESTPKDQVQPRLHSFQYLKPGDRIEQRWPRLFTREGREVPLDRALFDNPWSVDGYRWSEDGGTFYFVYNQRGHQVFRLLAVDAATGTVRTVVEERSPTFVDYPNKTWWYWLGDRELLWMSERDGFNHLYLVDVPTGRVARQVTTGPWMVREVMQVDPQARTVLVRAMGVHPDQDPYHVHWMRVPLDGSEPVRLTQGDGTHGLAFSPTGEWYVDTWSRVDQPPVHELRRASDGGLVTELARADISALEQAGWTRPERVRAKGRDGTTDIWGVVWRPAGTSGDQPLPVLECIYAGPQDFFVPKAFAASDSRRTMADEGFVVVQVDGMGTNWRGKAFHDVCWKNLRDAGLPDRVLWLKHAGSTRPWMDLARVGIYGGSAGGQNAMRALLDQPQMYKVGVADCGCHDNRMDKIWWNELWMGWPVDESYERSSNVADAHKLQGALMLIVGELDRNVDPASTMQVSAALSRAGRLHELVVVPGVGHGAAESPYGSAKRLDFLKRHLQGVQPSQQRE